MSVWCLGSINADHFYAVPHIPAPGETLSSAGLVTGLGGKGTNMSVAVARAGARVHHIGAVGDDGKWAIQRLMEYGVLTEHITQLEIPTGQAIIMVAEDGENSIVISPSANRAIPENLILGALSTASRGDILLLQNETNGAVDAARTARSLGLTVAYAAAPFEADHAREMLPLIDLLFLNEVELGQLSAALGQTANDLGVPQVVVTRGGDGADLYTVEGVTHVPAVAVDAVDTTGAGDTFTGYVIAGLDRGEPIAQALRRASLAAAIMVTRKGTADVIPDLKDIEDFRLGQ